MATCPQCLGPITENHRCTRRRLASVTGVGSTLLLGGSLGILVCFALADRPAAPVVAAAAALGAVLARAIRQAVGPR